MDKTKGLKSDHVNKLRGFPPSNTDPPLFNCLSISLNDDTSFLVFPLLHNEPNVSPAPPPSLDACATLFCLSEAKFKDFFVKK